MFSNERDQLRNTYFETWRKHQQQLPVAPLEAQLLAVILAHPEYHAILNDPETYQSHDFVETNPFLHMSLHLAIREQVGTDRPQGIREIYQRYCVTFQNSLLAEHQMMACLAEMLQEAQQTGKMADDMVYLAALRKNMAR